MSGPAQSASPLPRTRRRRGRGARPKAHDQNPFRHTASENGAGNTEEFCRLGGKTDEGASRRLVMGHLRLAVNAAKKFAGGGIDFEDLVQHAVVGLLGAANRFDPRRGVRFSYYAWPNAWVSCLHAIEDESSTIRIPSGARGALARFHEAHERSLATEGQAPSDLEMSSRWGPRKLRWLRRLERAAAAATLAADDPRLLSQVSPAVDAARELAREVDIRCLREALATLPQRHQEIIARRFGLGGRPEQTLREIAQDLGMSFERVRQVLANTPRTLGMRMRAHWPQSFPPAPMKPDLLEEMIEAVQCLLCSEPGGMSAEAIERRLRLPVEERVEVMKALQERRSIRQIDNGVDILYHLRSEARGAEGAREDDHTACS